MVTPAHMLTLKQFFEWEKWEGIMHGATLILFVVVVCMAVRHPEHITLTNVLLFAILVGVDTVVHQNINRRNRANVTYSRRMPL